MTKKGALWNSDTKVPDFIKRHTRSLKGAWFESSFVVPRHVPNPFKNTFDDEFLSENQKTGLTMASVYTGEQLSCKINKIKLPDVNIGDTSKIKFKSELKKGEKIIPNDHSRSNIAKSFSASYKFPEENSTINFSQHLNIKSPQRISIDFLKVTFGFKQVVPIICRCFMFDGNQIVSEPVDFLPENLPKKVSFELLQTTPDISLVLTYSIPITDQKITDIIKFMHQSSTIKEKEIKQKIKSQWFQQTDFNYTFAFSIARITDILSDPNFKFTKPVKTDGCPSNLELKSHLIESRQILDPFKITTEINWNVKNTKNYITLKASGIRPCSFVRYPKDSPMLSFRHRIIVALNEISIKAASQLEYVFTKIYLFNQSESSKIRAYVSPLTGSVVSEAYSKAKSGESHSKFSDIFTFLLPADVAGLILYVEPYGIGPSGLVMLGRFPLQLFDGKMIAPGTKQLSSGIGSVSIDVEVQSALLSDSTLVYDLLNLGLPFVDVTKIPTNELLSNLFQIITKITLSFDSESESESDAALRALFDLSAIIRPVFAGFDQFCVSYANDFAAVKKHNSVLKSWTKILSKEKPRKTDVIVFDFLFLIIAKSMSMADSISGLPRTFNRFIAAFAEAIDGINSLGLLLAKKACVSLATFLNHILDVGFVSAASLGVYGFVSRVKELDLVGFFLMQVWTPKHIAVTFPLCDSTIKSFSIVCQASFEHSDNRPIQGVFAAITRALALFDGSLLTSVTRRMLPGSSFLLPLHSDDQKVQPVWIFFASLLETTLTEQPAFEEWWHKISKRDVFQSINIIIDGLWASVAVVLPPSYPFTSIEDFFATSSATKRRSTIDHRKAPSIPADPQVDAKPIAYSAQIAILSFLRTVIMHSRRSVEEATASLHLLMAADYNTDIVSDIIFLVADTVKTHPESFFAHCQPSLAKFFAAVFGICHHWTDGYFVIAEVYRAEQKVFKSVKRSRAFFAHSVLIAGPSAFSKGDVSVLNQQPTQGLYARITDFLHVMRDSSPESMFAVSKVLKHSPDAVLDVLDRVAYMDQEEGQFAEEIQARMLAVAFVVEVLTQNGTIGRIFDREHPCESFDGVCSQAGLLRVDELPPRASGVVSSHVFSTDALERMIVNIANACDANQYYEYGIRFIKVCSPLFWDIIDYDCVDAVERRMCSRLESLAGKDGRLFGKFYRVTFIGRRFGHKNGRSFVYREKKLTHLFEVTRRLTQTYEKEFGEGVVEVIQESGAVDGELKNQRSKAYLQVTYVEPYFTKSERKGRSAFDLTHGMTKFCFDTPFTRTLEPGSAGGKAQGTVGTQWLRRTVLSCETPSPAATPRVEVVGTEELELPPIRVAFRQLKGRVEEMRSAIEAVESDGREAGAQALQQLLHGSLLAQVNEGPAKIAEVFLSQKRAKESDVARKYRGKLRDTFGSFLSQCEKGLKLHSEYANANSAFADLQKELDAGFDALKEELVRYEIKIGNDNIKP